MVICKQAQVGHSIEHDDRVSNFTTCFAGCTSWMGGCLPPYYQKFFLDVRSIENWREALRISFRKLSSPACNSIFACFVKNRLFLNPFPFFTDKTYFKLQGHRSLCKGGNSSLFGCFPFEMMDDGSAKCLLDVIKLVKIFTVSNISFDVSLIRKLQRGSAH